MTKQIPSARNGRKIIFTGFTIKSIEQYRFKVEEKLIEFKINCSSKKTPYLHHVILNKAL